MKESFFKSKLLAYNFPIPEEDPNENQNEEKNVQPEVNKMKKAKNMTTNEIIA